MRRTIVLLDGDDEVRRHHKGHRCLSIKRISNATLPANILYRRKWEQRELLADIDHALINSSTTRYTNSRRRERGGHARS